MQWCRWCGYGAVGRVVRWDEWCSGRVVHGGRGFGGLVAQAGSRGGAGDVGGAVQGCGFGADGLTSLPLLPPADCGPLARVADTDWELSTHTLLLTPLPALPPRQGNTYLLWSPGFLHAATKPITAVPLPSPAVVWEGHWDRLRRPEESMQGSVGTHQRDSQQRQHLFPLKMCCGCR